MHDEHTVELVVGNLFSNRDRAAALKILEEYGRESYHGEIHRVQLAVLMISQGRVESLRTAMDLALLDYRDALASAEYPRTMALGPGASGKALKQARKEDAEEYTEWLAANSRA